MKKNDSMKTAVEDLLEGFVDNRTRVTTTFVEWKSFTEWKTYGLDRDYDQRNSYSLDQSKIKSERRWHSKGERKDWIRKFPFTRKKMKSQFRNFQEWKTYGLERGYDNKNKVKFNSAVGKNAKYWYYRGLSQGWLKEFQFKDSESHLRFNSFTEWESYGLERGYDNKNPRSLSNGKDESARTWYSKGYRSGWIDNFEFKRKIYESPVKFDNFTEWKKYGLEHNYQDLIPSQLVKSEDLVKRYWLSKGRRENWINKFKFEKTRISWEKITKDEWVSYGLERGYDNLSPMDLLKNKNKKKKSWYIKGMSEKWLSDFEFNKKHKDLPYENMDEWVSYGLERGYDKSYASAIVRSKDSEKRSWYNAGRRRKWLDSFVFENAYNSVWGNYTVWKNYGIENGYNGRNPKSISTSTLDNERSWYARGVTQKWLKGFPFKFKKPTTTRGNLVELLLEEWVNG